MSIIKSKTSLIIAGSAAAAGLVICGIVKGIDFAKSKRSEKKEAKESAEEKPMKAVEDSEE